MILIVSLSMCATATSSFLSGILAIDEQLGKGGKRVVGPFNESRGIVVILNISAGHHAF